MITYNSKVEQGSEEWLALRCGLLTASEMKLIITPKTLKFAQNDKSNTHMYELAAQRITKYVERHYISDDMLRGQEDEVYARGEYMEHYGDVTECGFVTNDKWGFTIGYSPDGLVGDDGQIECKSRRQKYQIETICSNTIPDDYIIQAQTGLLVTERQYCDFISYCGGMPMVTIRVEPDPVVQGAIVEAATAFYDKLNILIGVYEGRLADKNMRLIPTERRIDEEMRI